MSEDAEPAVRRDDDLLRRVTLAVGHRAAGYRRVRSGPRARIRRRVTRLGLDDAGYVDLVTRDAAERIVAERLLTVTITRFFRDRRVWQHLQAEVAPVLAADRRTRAWCAGAACGEEAYSLALLLAERGVEPSYEPRIVATDLREDCVQRARRGRYPGSSVRDVPAPLYQRWFRTEGEEHVVDARVRRLVAVAPHDLWRDPWPRQVRVVLMRNVVFTYWNEGRQEEVLDKLSDAVEPHGWLVIGSHETLPTGAAARFDPVPGLPIYRKRD